VTANLLLYGLAIRTLVASVTGISIVGSAIYLHRWFATLEGAGWLLIAALVMTGLIWLVLRTYDTRTWRAERAKYHDLVTTKAK